MAKSMADRIDLGEISLPPTKGELDQLKKHVMKHMINMPLPNLVRHVYKVRRGKLTRIRIWQKVDLGLSRTEDLFVTSNDYELIPVEGTEIKVEDIIEKHSINPEDVEDVRDDDQKQSFTFFDF